MTAWHDHDLLDDLAQLLKCAVCDLRSVSIQDLDLVCRAHGSSLVRLVRGAESTVQRSLTVILTILTVTTVAGLLKSHKDNTPIKVG